MPVELLADLKTQRRHLAVVQRGWQLEVLKVRGTLHIFSAGIIYYAALSLPGELLPMPELHLIASELSRHTK